MSIPRRKKLGASFSNARAAFADNCDDVRSYYAIHQYAVKESQLLQKHLPVLDKSMFVLVASLWESYCEDVATEVLSLLADHCESPATLPTRLRQQVAREVSEDKNNLAVWDLAGDGWRDVLRTRSNDWARQRDWRFNSPKSAKVDEHFRQALGIERMSDNWLIEDGSAEETREALDAFIAQRGMIAHRGGKMPIAKRHVREFVNLVTELVRLIDANLEQHLISATPLARWPDQRTGSS